MEAPPSYSEVDWQTAPLLQNAEDDAMLCETHQPQSPQVTKNAAQENRPVVSGSSSNLPRVPVQETLIVVGHIGRFPAATEQVDPHMCMSLFALLCCCLPLGIAALVNSIFARDAQQRGDLVSARTSAAAAYKWASCSIAVGTLILLLYVAGTITGIITMAH